MPETSIKCTRIYFFTCFIAITLMLIPFQMMNRMIYSGELFLLIIKQFVRNGKKTPFTQSYFLLISETKRRQKGESLRSTSEGNSQKQEALFIFKHRMLGRFGNILFQYASTMDIANYTNRVAIFGKELMPLTSVFPKIKLNGVGYSSAEWHQVKETSPCDFDEKLLTLEKTNITLKGFLLSFRYFENISTRLYKDILSYMNDTLVSKAGHFIRQGKKRYELDNRSVPTTVCVHVGRGDKATKHAYKDHGVRVPSYKDIRSAMKSMETKYRHVIFIVASDDKEWCFRQISLLSENVHISNMTSYEEDFVLMSCCDHMIMTVGTFGWWAPWLTSQRGGTSMNYKYPFTATSVQRKQFDSEDHFPHWWKAYY